jgi:hypothetical protein
MTNINARAIATDATVANEAITSPCYHSLTLKEEPVPFSARAFGQYGCRRARSCCPQCLPSNDPRPWEAQRKTWPQAEPGWDGACGLS